MGTAKNAHAPFSDERGFGTWDEINAQEASVRARARQSGAAVHFARIVAAAMNWQ